MRDHPSKARGKSKRVAATPGIRLKLLMADIEGARFAVRSRFAPGILLPPHKHTGEVHAFTLAGEWSYLEHPSNPPSRAGSYLFEPPGSTRDALSRRAGLARRGSGQRPKVLRQPRLGRDENFDDRSAISGR